MEIQGKVVLNLGVERGTSKSGKAWSKASVVIETLGQYPRKVLLTNFRNADEFAKLAVNTEGRFHVEVESREWRNPNTGKTSWFTEVSCWKWELEAAEPPVESLGVEGLEPVAVVPPDDDLPF